MVNWNPEWDKSEDGQSSPEAEKKSVVEYLDELGRKHPAQRVFGSMKYPLAFKSFTMRHPIIGSAIIGVAFFAIMFVLGSLAAQGRDGVLLVVVTAALAVLVFAGNWVGARYERDGRSHDGRSSGV